MLSRPSVALLTAPAWAEEVTVAAATGEVAVGILVEPDHEALAALAPDLIVAGGPSVAVVEPSRA